LISNNYILSNFDCETRLTLSDIIKNPELRQGISELKQLALDENPMSKTYNYNFENIDIRLILKKELNGDDCATGFLLMLNDTDKTPKPTLKISNISDKLQLHLKRDEIAENAVVDFLNFIHQAYGTTKADVVSVIKDKDAEIKVLLI